jgi:putative two-component system response regulator
VSTKARILIIDDEEDICMFSKSALEKTGRYEVTFSTRAREGIDLAKSHKPDLILLDMRMPEMDGAEAARCLSEDAATSSIPVVFLSAVAVPAAFLIALLGNQETRQKSGAKEKYHFIQKPIAPADLVTRLEIILSGKAGNQN